MYHDDSFHFLSFSPKYQDFLNYRFFLRHKLLYIIIILFLINYSYKNISNIGYEKFFGKKTNLFKRETPGWDCYNGVYRDNNK